MRGALLVLGLVLGLVLSCVALTRAGADESTDAARARQLAAVLDLEPQIDRILHAPPPVTVEDSITRLNAIAEAMVALSRAGLDLEATIARLRHEEFEAKNAHDLIETRYQDSVTRWNIAAVLVGNGASIVGSGMQFGNDTVAKWGDGVVILGSAVAAAFSIVALVKRDVGPLPAPIETNMLAPLFDLPPTARSRYPAWIWRYLDTPLAGASGSIRHELVDKWAREGKLPRADLRRAAPRLTLLCAPLHVARRIDADALDNRADMLADVRDRLAGLSVDLELLWREIHALR
jgi:hypothetical protein